MSIKVVILIRLSMILEIVIIFENTLNEELSKLF